MELLRISQSGHLGTVMKTLKSLAAILSKNPKNTILEEIGKLELALERCEEQDVKIHELDELIFTKMVVNNAKRVEFPPIQNECPEPMRKLLTNFLENNVLASSRT